MDHSLAVGWVAAGPDEVLEHRRLGLLGLQEQRVGVVAAEEQHDPRSRADAAHAHDLAGRVDQAEVLQEVAAVALERLAVAAHRGSQEVHDLLAVDALGDLLDGLDEWRVADDAPLAVDDVGELGEGLRAVAGAGLGHVGLGSLADAESTWPCSCLKTVSTSMWAYHTSRLDMVANLRIADRYSPRRPSSTFLRSLAEYPLSRPAIAKLAARRLTSHSHGPGNVSSKSLMSKTRRRSGEPKMPKFIRCASPHACAVRPERGVPARSLAMMSAAPR